MKLRAVISITVCIALLGTSVVPAAMLPCCCSLKKTEASCCSIPSVESQPPVPSCCQAKSGVLKSETGLKGPQAENCGLSGNQASFKCMCASHTKAPVVTDARSSSQPAQDSFYVCNTLAGLVDTCDFPETVPSLTPSPPVIAPLLQSCSLRI